MDRDTIRFILDSLPDGRTVFYDFPDRYAVLLLHTLSSGESGCSVADLKKSSFASLLQKPRVREFLAKQGRPRLEATDLAHAWPDRPEAYRLTLGVWPDLDRKPSRGWDQITRWGWNLVLQLNFTASHRERLSESVPDWQEVLRHTPHPIADPGELTLAWARIDLDLKTGEALIEEIQSDWVRDVPWYASRRDNKTAEAWQKYLAEFLAPHLKRWPETMLTATLWFLVHELGLRQIFFHTERTGSRLKRIRGAHPPRSIYSQLPRKFCFQVTHNGPLFIRDTARRELKQLFTDPETTWFFLDLPDPMKRPPTLTGTL